MKRTQKKRRRRGLRAALGLGAMIAVAAPGVARADDGTGLVVNATMLSHTGEGESMAPSAGIGGDITLLPDEFVMVSMGGFAALAQPRGKRDERDLYDVHFGVAWRAGDELGVMQPLMGLNLHALSVTTRTRGETHRGTTIGVSAQLGAVGAISDRWMYRISGSYLGAIVPGTGDDLGGLVLQLGLGRRFEM